MPISQPVAEVWRFFDFFKMADIRHLGCHTRAWTTHEEYLLAFVDTQSLAGSGAVVLTICKFNIARVRLEMRIHVPKNLVVWDISLPLWGAVGISTRPQNGTSLRGNVT